MPTGKCSPHFSSKKTSLCSTRRPLQKTPIEQNADVWSTVPVDASTTQRHLRKGSRGRGDERLEEPEEQEVCCETVTPTNVRETQSMKSYQHG